jgi:branched-chain amino acid aminotransferase
MISKTKKIWMDGRFVDWDKASVHILTHTLQYGLGVFEGIRCYETVRGPAIFRLDEHVERLFTSAHIFLIDIPYSKEEIKRSVIEGMLYQTHRLYWVRCYGSLFTKKPY